MQVWPWLLCSPPPPPNCAYERGMPLSLLSSRTLIAFCATCLFLFPVGKCYIKKTLSLGHVFDYKPMKFCYVCNMHTHSFCFLILDFGKMLQSPFVIVLRTSHLVSGSSFTPLKNPVQCVFSDSLLVNSVEYVNGLVVGLS